jgi:hypothetical protein
MIKNPIKMLVVSVTVAIFAIAPALAFAQTATDTPSTAQLQQEIQNLLSQLSALQQMMGQGPGDNGSLVNTSGSPSSSPSLPPLNITTDLSQFLTAIISTSTVLPSSTISTSTIGGLIDLARGIFCLNITRDLSLGAQGADVSQLQSLLSQDPTIYPQGSITGYFGPLTQQAVIRFQEKYGISASATGFVGPITRRFFGNHCPGLNGGTNNASGTVNTTGTIMHIDPPQPLPLPVITGTSTAPGSSTEPRPLPPVLLPPYEPTSTNPGTSTPPIFPPVPFGPSSTNPGGPPRNGPPPPMPPGMATTSTATTTRK